jgi:hypothetical protein
VRLLACGESRRRYVEGKEATVSDDDEIIYERRDGTLLVCSSTKGPVIRYRERENVVSIECVNGAYLIKEHEMWEYDKDGEFLSAASSLMSAKRVARRMVENRYSDILGPFRWQQVGTNFWWLSAMSVKERPLKPTDRP